MLSGSEGIYANSLFSFPAFLTQWALGATFTQAVMAANQIDPLHTQDELSKSYYRDKNQLDRAKKVNSTRVIGGGEPDTTRIKTAP